MIYIALNVVYMLILIGYLVKLQVRLNGHYPTVNLNLMIGNLTEIYPVIGHCQQNPSVSVCHPLHRPAQQLLVKYQ